MSLGLIDPSVLSRLSSISYRPLSRSVAFSRWNSSTSLRSGVKTWNCRSAWVTGMCASSCKILSSVHSDCRIYSSKRLLCRKFLLHHWIMLRRRRLPYRRLPRRRLRLGLARAGRLGRPPRLLRPPVERNQIVSSASGIVRQAVLVSRFEVGDSQFDPVRVDVHLRHIQPPH